MTVSTTVASSVGYYTAGGGVARGAENYYTGGATPGEPPGVWRGGEAYGLEGVVDPKVMEQVFGKFLAPDGTKLGPAPKANGTFRAVAEQLAEWKAEHPYAIQEDIEVARVALERASRNATLGYDVTTSVVKSASVAWAAVRREELDATRSGDAVRLADATRARLVLEAGFDAANAATLAYLGKVATSRIGRHGGKGTAGQWIKVADGGLLIGEFRQHTSRAIQPQIHTHNVTHSRVTCADGKIRSLDSVDLFAHRPTMSAVHDRTLMEYLVAHGVDMELWKGDNNERPSWEIKGVDREACDLFSARRVTITKEFRKLAVKAADRLGRELTGVEAARLKQQITRDTRARKTGKGESEAAMLDRWERDTHQAVGRSLAPIGGRIIAAIKRGPVAREAATFSESSVLAASVAAVSAGAAAWSRDELFREIQERVPVTGLPGEDVIELLERLTDRALADAGLVTQTGGREVDPLPAELGGPGVFDRPTSAKFSATGSLEAEEAIRRQAVTGGAFHLEAEAVNAWLDEHRPTVGVDQRGAAVGITTSDKRLTELIGPAGSGKSYTLETISDLWGDLSAGGRVQGLAVSQNAADVLDVGGVQITANVAAWLDAQERIARGRARPSDHVLQVRARDLVVVDEASMLATKDLARIRQVVDDAGARMLAAGDPNQLASIEAGGVMGLLDGYAQPFSLTEVRRFQAKWEGAASLRLRERDVDVLREYERRGRIVSCDTIEDAIGQASRVAAADRLEGRAVVVTASTNEEAAQIAAAVRDQLIEAGVVHPDRGTVDLTEHGGSASIGDLVMCRKNNTRLGVTNRELYEVLAIGEDDSLTVVSQKTQKELRLPASYVRDRVASGYAGTVHSTQGLDVDAGYLVTAGNIDPTGAYVGLTRGRYMNKVFVSTKVADPNESKPQAEREMESGQFAVAETSADKERPSGLAVLASVLEKDVSGRQAGLVTREQDDARLRDMSTVLGRLEAGMRVAYRGWTDRHLDELAAVGAIDAETRARLGAEEDVDRLAQMLRAQEQAGHDPGALLRHAAMNPMGFDSARSVSQVLHGRITRTVEQSTGSREVGPAVTAHVPAGMSREATWWFERKHEEIAARRRELGTEVGRDLPEWAERAFGPVPDGPMERLEWEQKAGVVAAYREAVGYEDQRRAIGNAPGIHSPERRQMWEDSFTALDRPADAREEAGMTDGQLRVRAMAWEREQALAPAHANAAMKVAHLEADDARVTATLAETDEQAATVKAVGRQRSGEAEVLSGVATAHDEWIEKTAATRVNARRAAKVLAERGVEWGEEPDRMTAAEWLAEQRAADAAAERRRIVGEVEVVDPVAAEVAVDAEARSDDLAVTERVVPGRAGDEQWTQLLETGEEPPAEQITEEDLDEPMRGARTTVPVRASSLQLDAASQHAAWTLDELQDRDSQEVEASRTVYDDAYDEAQRVAGRESAHEIREPSLD